MLVVPQPCAQLHQLRFGEFLTGAAKKSLFIKVSHTFMALPYFVTLDYRKIAEQSDVSVLGDADIQLSGRTTYAEVLKAIATSAA